MIKTLAQTITWVAEERIKSGEQYQDMQSAIHAVTMDIWLELYEMYKARRRNDEEDVSGDDGGLCINNESGAGNARSGPRHPLQRQDL
jgi:hypothetical protein